MKKGAPLNRRKKVMMVRRNKMITDIGRFVGPRVREEKKNEEKRESEAVPSGPNE